MAKLGFTGLALACCLALTSCVTTPGIELDSPFKYPEAQNYVNCAVDYARKRTFNDPQWIKNDYFDIPILGSERECEAEELLFQMRARADGVPAFKLDNYVFQLQTKIWRITWDEVFRVREERRKAMGAVR